jgi:hypothetical protein
LEYIEESLPGEVENEVLKIFKHSKYELNLWCVLTLKPWKVVTL